MVIEVSHTKQDEIEIDYEGRIIRLAFNPNTNYVLMPESMYQSEAALVMALQNESFVDGIYSHESIRDLK